MWWARISSPLRDTPPQGQHSRYHGSYPSSTQSPLRSPPKSSHPVSGATPPTLGQPRIRITGAWGGDHSARRSEAIRANAAAVEQSLTGGSPRSLKSAPRARSMKAPFASAAAILAEAGRFPRSTKPLLRSQHASTRTTSIAELSGQGDRELRCLRPACAKKLVSDTVATFLEQRAAARRQGCSPCRKCRPRDPNLLARRPCPHNSGAKRTGFPDCYVGGRAGLTALVCGLLADASVTDLSLCCPPAEYRTPGA